MARKRISAEKKVEILRELLDNKKSLTKLAEEYNVHPQEISRWKKELFEGALQTFAQSKKNPTERKKQEKIKKLEETLQKRDTLIAELVSENIDLKKTKMGTINWTLGRA